VVIAAAGVATETETIEVAVLPMWAQGAFYGFIDSGGAGSMSVTAAGKITGKIGFAGVNYTFSAASFASGNKADGFVISTTAKAGKTAYPLTLTVAVPEIEDETGTVPDTLGVADGVLDNGGWIRLFRSVWKDAGMAPVAAKYAGYYTAALPPGDGGYGSGYLLFTADKSGGVKTAGKLADGTAVSTGGSLVLDEWGRVYAVLYSAPAAYKGGSLFGFPEFVLQEEGAGQYAVVRRLGGWSDSGTPLVWSSLNPQATGAYGDGFNRTLELTGGWYSKTADLGWYYDGLDLSAGTDANAPTPGLTVGTVRYDALCWDPSGIALTPTLKLGAMAGLSAPPAGKPVDPEKDGIWDYGAANSVGLKVSLTRATGIFKGSFNAWFDYPLKKHVSKSLAFEGVLTPVRENPADGVAGRGYYLWPDKAVPPLPARPYSFKWSYDFRILMSE
jgi:hypothetical protein